MLGSAVFVSAGCALVQSPTQRASAIADEAGFRLADVGDTGLRAYLRKTGGADNNGSLTIYIESDGAPWPSPNRPPGDPTPVKQVVLEMAASDPSSMVAYLSRPCQYLSAESLSHCSPEFWTHGRFSEAAISKSTEAVQALKNATNATRISLVGYSGGGTVAALLSARRTDVNCLVTVASPLDTNAWTKAIGVSPLRTSLNPAQVATQWAHLPQTHFTGGNDEVVPAYLAPIAVATMPSATIVMEQKFTHNCCWAEEWRRLRSASCLANKR